MSFLDPALRVLVPDRPGYGDNPEPATGIAGNADAMFKLLDREGARKAVVVAHSWAGGVALQMALDDPGRIAGIVLVSSIGPGAVTPIDHFMTLPGVSRITATIGVRLSGAAFHPRVSGTLSHLLEARLRNAVTSLLRRDRQKRLAHTYEVEQLALVNETPGLMERIGSIRVPVRILHARNDRVIPVRVARALRTDMPGSEIRVLAKGSHYLPLLRPEAVASTIASVLGPLP